MPGRFPLEPPGPLSRSLLWDLQRRAYESLGVLGWQAGAVPQYATTNPRFAAAYASVLLGFLRDCHHRRDHDPTEAINVVELGAGPGRFGWLLVGELLDQVEGSRLRDTPFRYVLTDLAQSNVEFWLAHPKLAPLLDAGIVDVARFDATRDDAVTLQVSGVTLRAGDVANPVAVVANYLLDSIPQDAFQVVRGELVGLHAAATSTRAEPDLTDPELMARVQLVFEPAALADAVPGLDEATVALLERHRALGDSGPLLLPSAALGCLGRLGALGAGRLLLLTGDKGYAAAAALRDADDPEVVAHGPAFSLTVDFATIAAWFERRGGRWLGSDRPSRLHVSAGLLGFGTDGDDDAVETAGAYQRAVADQEPVDVYTVLLEREEPEDDLERILALVRLSGGDHEVLLQHLPVLTGRLGDLEDDDRVEVGRLLRLVWERYFPIGEDTDVPYFLSRAAFEIGDLGMAIELLHRSVEIYGPTGWTLYNLAQCLLAAGDPEGADAAAAAAEAFPETADEARALRSRLGA